MAASNQPHANKTAIVTGASRGIGAAIAENLASKGCNVLLNYTSQSSTSKTADFAKELSSKYGVKAVPVQADMGSVDCGRKLVDAALKAFGNPKNGNLTVRYRPLMCCSKNEKNAE